MGNVCQQSVAHDVAVAVVDGFEPVQVQIRHCNSGALTFGLHHGLAQTLSQQHAVRQACDVVVMRNAFEVQLLRFLNADVGVTADQTFGLALCITLHHLTSVLDPDDLAILAQHSVL